MWPFLCVFARLCLSPQDTSPVGIGPIVRTFFDLNHLLEGLVPDTVALGVRLSQANFGQDTVQFVAVSATCVVNAQK